MKKFVCKRGNHEKCFALLIAPQGLS